MLCPLQMAEHCHVCCCCHLQCKTRSSKKKKQRKPRQAKSTTQKEFEDVMNILVQEAKKELEKKGIPASEVRFQYDNNRIQATASLEHMGMDEASKVHLPKYSPDLAKAIEHVFAQLKPAIMKQLSKLSPGELTAAKAQKVAEQCFKALNPKHIQKDISDLPTLWRVVAADKGVEVPCGRGRFWYGTEGAYPPRELR